MKIEADMFFLENCRQVYLSYKKKKVTNNKSLFKSLFLKTKNYFLRTHDVYIWAFSVFMCLYVLTPVLFLSKLKIQNIFLTYFPMTLTNSIFYIPLWHLTWFSMRRCNIVITHSLMCQKYNICFHSYDSDDATIFLILLDYIISPPSTDCQTICWIIQLEKSWHLEILR